MRFFILAALCSSVTATLYSIEYTALGEWISDYREGYFSGALTRRQWAFQIERVLEKVEQELERAHAEQLQPKARETGRGAAIVLGSKKGRDTRATSRLLGIARDMKKSFGRLWNMHSDLQIVNWSVNNRLAIEGWTVEADRILAENQQGIVRTSAQYIVMILSDLKAVMQ